MDNYTKVKLNTLRIGRVFTSLAKKWKIMSIVVHQISHYVAQCILLFKYWCYFVYLIECKTQIISKFNFRYLAIMNVLIKKCQSNVSLMNYSSKRLKYKNLINIFLYHISINLRSSLFSKQINIFEISWWNFLENNITWFIDFLILF